MDPRIATRTDKRAFLLAASNCVVGLDEAVCILGVYETWMQGLTESGHSEGVAVDIIEAETDSFDEFLKECGIGDDDPMPSYWQDVDDAIERFEMLDSKSKVPHSQDPAYQVKHMYWH